MPMNPEFDDAHAAAIYRAIALRFFARYVAARTNADYRGGDVPDHGPLQTERDADERYHRAAEGCVKEAAESADAALALVEFAGVLAADKLIGELTQAPVNDERDAYHQARALANVAGWINSMIMTELVEREPAFRRGPVAVPPNDSGSAA
jgi:hypothetical protein